MTYLIHTIDVLQYRVYKHDLVVSAGGNLVQGWHSIILCQVRSNCR
jgi:hypothetical protein